MPKSNNPWIEHVRAYAKEHGLSYMCSVEKARASYVKQEPNKKPTKKKSSASVPEDSKPVKTRSRKIKKQTTEKVEKEVAKKEVVKKVEKEVSKIIKDIINDNGASGKSKSTLKVYDLSDDDE